MDPDKRDLYLLVASRGTRSFAGGILSVIISLYFQSIYHSYAAVGILFAAAPLGVPFISLMSGRLADRHGRKKLLLLTLSFLPAAIAIVLLTTNYYMLLLASALGGFGIAGGLVGGGVGATVVPMQSALLAEKTNMGNRTLVFSLFTMMSSLTGAAGAAAAGLGSYHTLFYITLAFATFSFAVALPIKETFTPKQRLHTSTQQEMGEKGGRSETDSEGNAQRERENRGIIRKFMMTGGVNGTAQGLIIPFLPLVLSDVLHMTKGTIGELFALGGVLTAFSMLATPYLTGRLGFVRFIIYTRAISSVFMLYFPFASTVIAASLSYLIFSILRAISLPSQASLMMSIVNEETRANASGSNQAARLMPSAGGSALSGVIQEYLNYVIPFEIAFVLSGVNIYLYHLFFAKLPIANKRTVVGQED